MNRKVLFFMVFLFFSSCTTTIVTHKKKPVLHITNLQDSIIKERQNRLKEVKSIFLKGKVYISRKQGDATFNIIVNHYTDTFTWASISGPFGIELFRLKVDQDSAQIINHINKTFSIKPLSFFKIEDFLLSENYFFELQNIIMATPTILDVDYTYAIEKDNFFLNSEKYKYKVSNTFRVTSANLQVYPSRQIQYNFENFEKQNEFPKKQTITLNDDRVIKLNYSVVQFNKEANTSFKIPLEYVEED